MDAVQVLEQTLLGCTQPSTEVIRASEEALKKLLVGSQSIPPLVQLIRFSPHQSVRQLASVLLRVKLGTLNWMKLSPDRQEACRALLLESVMLETNRQIRICNCYAVATLAKSQFAQPAGWPQLLQLIRETTSLENTVQNREIGFLLMYTLTDSLVTYFAQSMPEFVAIFKQSLEASASNNGNSNASVVLAVLRATTSMIECVSEEEEVLFFKPLVPLLLGALNSHTVDNDDDEFHISTMVQIIETMAELTESSQPVLDGDAELGQVFLVLAKLTARAEGSIRSAAATALSDMICDKTRFLVKHADARNAVLQACLALCRDTALESDEDEEDENNGGGGDMSLAEMAEMLVTAYATSLPTKLVIDTLLHVAAGMVQQQQVDKEREAGLIALIIASEGMASELVEDAYATSFDTLLELVLACVSDQASRGTLRHALLLLGQWTEHLYPLMETHAERVLGIAVHYMARAQNEPRIFTPACYMAQQYCAAMEEDELAPYVAGIVEPVLRFFAAVQLAPRTVTLYTSAIETISYLCTSAGARFGPYFDTVLAIVAPLMNLTGEDDFLRKVRSHATALMGQLAYVSTQCTKPGQPNPFFVFVPELLNKCFVLLNKPKNEEEGDDDEDLDFRDSAHHLFANVARALQTDLEPFLPQILDVLMRDCVSNDGDVVQTARNRDGKEFALSDSVKQLAMEEEEDGEEGEDGENDDDPSVKMLTSVREAAADSKASAFAALETLCEVYVNSKLDHIALQQRCVITPNLERIMVDLCGKTIDEYLHPGVRKCAVSCLGGALLLAFRAEARRPVPTRDARIAYASSTLKDADMDLKWLPGDMTHLASFPEACRLSTDIVLPYLVETMTCENDKEVAAEACNTLERIVSYSGLTLIATQVPDICDALLTLLEGRGVCQRASDQVDDDGAGGGEDEDEARRHDEILLDSVVECLVIVCKAMGRENLVQIMGLLLPSLLKRSKSSMPTKDRITTVGCLSMIISFAGTLGSNLKQYKNKLLNVAFDSIRQNEDACLRRNGLVLLGMLLERNDEMQVNPLDCLDQIMFVFTPQQQRKGGPSHHPRKWEEEDLHAVLDNACSVVAKVLRLSTLNEQAKRAIGGELLKHLPLRFDHEEDWTVYSSVVHILPVFDNAQIMQSVVPITYQAMLALDQEELALGATQCLITLAEQCASRLGGANALPIEFSQLVEEIKRRLVQQVDLRVV